MNYRKWNYENKNNPFAVIGPDGPDKLQTDTFEVPPRGNGIKREGGRVHVVMNDEQLTKWTIDVRKDAEVEGETCDEHRGEGRDVEEVVAKGEAG